MINHAVFLAACSDYQTDLVEAAVRRAVDGLGGIKRILDGRVKVLLKPNLVMPRSPESAATTHPSIVRAMCRLCVDAGAQVTVCDSPGGFSRPYFLRKTYAVCGMTKVAEETGAQLSFDSTGQTVNIGGRVAKTLDILKEALDCECIFSLAKAKTHAMATYSGAVKNLFGLVPGVTKVSYHAKWPESSDFFGMIVDLCEFLKPTFSLIDGVIGMEGEGPTAGTPKHMGVLIASCNPHSADLAACELMATPAAHVKTLREAINRRLVPPDAASLTLLGDRAERFFTPFAPALTYRKSSLYEMFMPARVLKVFKRLTALYPVAGAERCTACGVCMQLCPVQAITTENGLPKINKKKCIQCYCCHEMCPRQAMHV